MNWTILLGSFFFALVGLLVFVLAYIIFDRLIPKLTITKILIEDKNMALGIVLAGVFIGLAMIISSAIK